MILKNNTDQPLWVEEDQSFIKPKHVRIYEFLHGWDDITIEEFDRRENHPAMVILREEIQKEINAEIIRHINNVAKG